MKTIAALAVSKLRTAVAVSRSNLRFVRVAVEWVLWRDNTDQTFTLVDGRLLEVRA